MVDTVGYSSCGWLMFDNLFCTFRGSVFVIFVMTFAFFAFEST